MSESSETLISDSEFPPRVYHADNDLPDLSSPILNQDLPLSLYNYKDDEDEASVLCLSGSRFVFSGFTQSDFKEDFVMFVNAGSGTLNEGDTSMELKPDICYHGGNVFRTEADITDGGDYPSIYQSARCGSFCYEFKDLVPGHYFVDLHFVEFIYTNGPKGIRVFNVFVQDEKVLSELDIFSVVGANKPLQLVDASVLVGENGTIELKFEGVRGNPVVSGICIRRASKALASNTKSDYIICDNCATEVEVPQMKLLQAKATAKYEKKIHELTHQNQHKTNECYEAWMSLTAANDQLDKIRMELGDSLCQVNSLGREMEKQSETLKDVSSKYERDKKMWASTITNLDERIKIMKKEQSQLSREAHECADSVPELNNMVFAVQALVAQCEDLKLKYNEEQEKRKKLHNQVQEAKGNIRVFCRCRPLSKEETAARYSTIVDFDAAKDGDLGVVTGSSSKKIFKFDRVYTPKDDQVDVFVDASPMVVSVLDGYNVCIFAYGQTGTGKTFTMEGTEHNRGVNYRTLEELFKVSKERSETFSYGISVSVLEVYNEQIRDLLATSPSSKKLEIRQASEGVHHVPGIVEAKVENIKQVWDVLQAGSNARAVGSNNVNEHSSRSHCMLCIMVKSKNKISGECTNSKLWLVDLAGSERLAKTDAQGERLKEAQNINKSLSALGDVISALANKSSHIPYRNSKLTHLLQDSLGGDSKTLMFVQISPSENDLGETISSLNFATRVRGVELGPAKKQTDSGELQKIKTMLDRARQESRSKDEALHKLEENLQNLENKTRSKDQIFKSQQDKLKDLEGQLSSNIESQNQLEKQLWQTMEKLKGKEEAYITLQHKVKELENKTREKENSESIALQQKIKEDRAQHQSECMILQLKVKELETKLKEREQNSESPILRLKVKELEDRLREREQLIATPQVHQVGLRDESMNETEPQILRSMNSENRPPLMESDLLKGHDPLREIRRKRVSRGGEGEYGKPSSFFERRIMQAEAKKPKQMVNEMEKSENNYGRASFPERKMSSSSVVLQGELKKVKQIPSDPSKGLGRFSRTITKGVVMTGIQRGVVNSRVNRDQVVGIKGKDTTRGWSR